MERETFYHTDKDGRISEIEIATGKVVAHSASVEDMAVSEHLPISAQDPKSLMKWRYNNAYGDFICQKIAEGMTMTKLTKLDGMPSLGTVTRWRVENPVFDEGLALARKARAERVFDEIYESRDEEYDREELQAAKLSFDKKKFLAASDDPDSYGPKKANEGGGEVHVTLTVDTGIDRTPITVETECREIGND